MSYDEDKTPRKRVRVSLDAKRLSERLLSRRKELGWSLRELAERSGVSTSAVHAMEQGNTRAQLDNFVAVLAALDVRPEYVFDVDEDTSPRERPMLERKLEEISRLDDPAKALRRLAALLDKKR